MRKLKRYTPFGPKSLGRNRVGNRFDKTFEKLLLIRLVLNPRSLEFVSVWFFFFVF